MFNAVTDITKTIDASDYRGLRFWDTMSMDMSSFE